jgi:hypothetical protein
MPLQATSGAASYDAFGGGAAVPNYIEDVFQTWLYTGNGSTQTITNGIDLAGKGGMVWLKSRSAATNNFLFDTNRGALNELNSNNTEAQASLASSLTAFNSNGFSLGSATGINVNAATYASWTFRKQPKFFDVVTYTGDANPGRTVTHSLASAPGCVIIKRTDSTGSWAVWHAGAPTLGGRLENAGEFESGYYSGFFNSTQPTSAVFTVGNDSRVNASGGTYVAYLFAHNAGGFGLTGTDNVISCGSFTTDGSGKVPAVNLGYEPQWVLIKPTVFPGNWEIIDTMRGWTNSSPINTILRPNSNDEESTANVFSPTATGFQSTVDAGGAFPANEPYIYIAIRRGPMKVPTTGTSVFIPVAQTTTAPSTITTNFPVDAVWWRNSRTTAGRSNFDFDRLRGGTQQLVLNTTTAENTISAPNSFYFDSNTSFTENFSNAGQDAIFWNFRRAPGFFDEVCYTGDGASSRQINHNLQASPEIVIIKNRTSSSSFWNAGVFDAGGTRIATMALNQTSASGSVTNYFVSGSLNFNSSSFNVRSDAGASATNISGNTYVAYLFATCPGVSKVGSFTGTGATQVINCGFTGGARFVLIKATSTTGNWLVWDSARGIVAGNDPYLALNSTAAEVTNTDWVDTAATGFELSNAGGNLANSNGVSYIFLAIA